MTDPPPVSDPLSDLMLDLPEGQDLELGDLLERLGTRAHGTAILLLSLPDAIPLPVPSVGAILGIPLILVSLHLALFGDAARLPARVRRLRLPARSIGVLKRYVAPYLARAERLSQRRRWSPVADRQRLVGVVCLLLSVLLLLPDPVHEHAARALPRGAGLGA